MNTLALSRIYLPGEAQFPLTGMYARPANRQEEGKTHGQLRHIHCYIIYLQIKFATNTCHVLMCAIKVSFSAC